jgi:hypothetical protein
MHDEASDGESPPRFCCDHARGCSVHQLPFDGEYVRCTCDVGVGSLRHERVLAPMAAGAPTLDTLARAAQGALIALQSGENELAARLLSDVLDRAGPGGDASGSDAGATRAKPPDDRTGAK